MSILKGSIAVAVPALCGSVGGVLGGLTSDGLVRGGRSLTFARKLPIIAGMLLSMSMILCNYTASQTVVMVLMSVAFFGKGFGALGWTVIADTSPRNLIGVNGGLFNLFGNLSSITTPIVIGFLVQRTGNFNLALIFVGATAAMAIVSYLFIVGDIRRLELGAVAA
jgi:ACS family glucarate transporter-like MFS transporter